MVITALKSLKFCLSLFQVKKVQQSNKNPGKSEHLRVALYDSLMIQQMGHQDDRTGKRPSKPADGLNLSLLLMEVSFQESVCAERQCNTASDNCHSTIFLFTFQDWSPGHKLFLATWPIPLHTDTCQFKFTQGNLCGQNLNACGLTYHCI